MTNIVKIAELKFMLFERALISLFVKFSIDFQKNNNYSQISRWRRVKYVKDSVIRKSCVAARPAWLKSI
jgi:hypothetical protein